MHSPLLALFAYVLAVAAQSDPTVAFNASLAAQCTARCQQTVMDIAALNVCFDRCSHLIDPTPSPAPVTLIPSTVASIVPTHTGNSSASDAKATQSPDRVSPSEANGSAAAQESAAVSVLAHSAALSLAVVAAMFVALLAL
ncbi:hypothetical protein BC828DRAFT_402681 [Blastocladiella britannica]|nr:hypothetical protein BC828DRAFT_402681 [Blastocladiella britannica]